MFSKLKGLRKFRGSLLAGACGDALGYPIEFKSIDSIRRYGKNGIEDMILKDGKGTISDDTQMSIYTAQGLIHGFEKKCDYAGMIQEIHKSYYRWYLAQNDYLSNQMKALYPIREIMDDDLLKEGKNLALRARRAPGNTCLSGLNSGILATTEKKINDSKGCGGIMRIAPISVVFWKEPETAFQYAVDASALTHGHELGYLSSGALAMILCYIYQDKSLMESIELTVNYLKENYKNTELIRVIEDAVGVAEKQLVDENAFALLGQGWVAEETLAIALWACLMYPTDMKKALLASVNHSGDSDSTGAVCGYIMGALLGENEIPKEWIDTLELHELIAEQTEKLATFAL